ncbi:nitrous oxide-stimulated promoter family protein [Geoalkalibacter sp.]|uniref:nitrous oxide-stimulated promoter family protein n=1 Tax=Geoalkalibacter sp. TaxID=3041440 RepID=UPI00272E5D77|nr:nitrous oxide-stimulated promoter family protein [Geoalkalibacter sp.]
MNSTTSIATLDAKEAKDLRVLVQFTAVYCRVHHAEPRAPLSVGAEWRGSIDLSRFELCDSCREFLDYAIERRLRCPLDPKPICKHCRIHCYRPGHREKVREIMRFSGKYLLKRGRLDLLWHYYF